MTNAFNNDKSTSTSRTKKEEQDSQKGFSPMRVVQDVAAWVVIASITAVAIVGSNSWVSLWAHINSNASAVKDLQHKDQEHDQYIAESKKRFEKVDEFQKWPRFTEQDFNRSIQPMLQHIDDLEGEVIQMESRIDTCRDNVFALRERLAGLNNEIHFPFDKAWQQRIRDNEKTIEILKHSRPGSGIMGPIIQRENYEAN